MCPEAASLWTKIHNEPYLRTHKKTLMGYLIYSTVWQYIVALGVLLVGAYISTVVFGALGVMLGW